MNRHAVDCRKCFANRVEQLKKIRFHNSDLRPAKLVIMKIKDDLHSYGINLDVILNEIKLFVEALSPIKRKMKIRQFLLNATQFKMFYLMRTLLLNSLTPLIP